MKVTKACGMPPKDTTITTGDPVFLDITKPPFRLYGLCEPFRRIPEAVAKQAGERVDHLSQMSAGARVRFSTDSDYVVIHAEIEGIEKFPQDSAIAVTGFDLFQAENGSYRFLSIMAPSQGEGKTYAESRVRLAPGKKDLILSLPLFAKIRSATIALREGSEVDFGGEYRCQTPIVFYGSSIVHGVGAGRPSSNYPAIAARHLDSDFLNLGLSGAAKAEDAILDYISGLGMSVFVYDYDYNAPDADYLAKTHFEGYRRFRAAQPETPVIMASKVDYFSNPEANEKRREIILDSYRRGIAAGDRHLYFIDGSTIYDPDYRNESTCDGCHPNDAGYLAMAKAFAKVIKEAMAEANIR